MIFFCSKCWRRPCQCRTEVGGLCVNCSEVGIVLLGGHTFYCWDHYCAEMQRQRDTQQPAPEAVGQSANVAAPGAAPSE